MSKQNRQELIVSDPDDVLRQFLAIADRPATKPLSKKVLTACAGSTGFVHPSTALAYIRYATASENPNTFKLLSAAVRLNHRTSCAIVFREALSSALAPPAGTVSNVAFAARVYAASPIPETVEVDVRRIAILPTPLRRVLESRATSDPVLRAQLDLVSAPAPPPATPNPSKNPPIKQSP